MEVLFPRCCGLDVHKASLTACILINGPDGKQRDLCRFGTMTRDVMALANWLTQHGVQKLAMESTGVYWKPIWNLLEGCFDLMHFDIRIGRGLQPRSHTAKFRQISVLSCSRPSSHMGSAHLYPTPLPRRKKMRLAALSAATIV
jgi:hypothetical protein